MIKYNVSFMIMICTHKIFKYYVGHQLIVCNPTDFLPLEEQRKPKTTKFLKISNLINCKKQSTQIIVVGPHKHPNCRRNLPPNSMIEG